MKSQVLTTKTLILTGLVFSSLAFILGAGFSYQADRKHFSESGQLSLDHLAYAMSLKDDMAVIDWSKKLETFEDVLAFRAAIGEKLVARGGNQNFISSSVPLGSSFKFPSLWLIHLRLTSAQEKPADIILVFQSERGPLFWGLFGFWASLFSALLIHFLTKRLDRLKTGGQEISQKDSRPVSAGAWSRPMKDGAFLLLDNNFVIRQLSPEGAKLLQKSPEQIVGRHLFDLAPLPSLITALEKGEEVKVLNPFSIQPGLSAALKLDPQGTFMLLEPVRETETPKKH